MSFIPDRAIAHLQAVIDAPDLSGTRYALVRELARGGMGTVYLAEDGELRRSVALKVLHASDVSDDAVERMRREAQVLARLEHPNIVPVHDVGTLPDGRAFYVMKYVQGTRLDRLAQSGASRGDLLRMFQKICEAVAFAHSQGVIHRDLKPENIMVGAFGEVLVMDWGVAKLLGSAEPSAGAAPAASGGTAHGTVIGTPAYMAPEQARGEIARMDPRSDIYSLGAVLRFLLTGQPPDQPLTSGAAPRPLLAICRKAMSAEPAGRYANAQDLAADVVRYIDGEPVAAYPEGPIERAGRWLRRHQAAVVLIVAYLLMRAALLFFSRR